MNINNIISHGGRYYQPDANGQLQPLTAQETQLYMALKENSDLKHQLDIQRLQDDQQYFQEQADKLIKETAEAMAQVSNDITGLLNVPGPEPKPVKEHIFGDIIHPAIRARLDSQPENSQEPGKAAEKEISLSGAVNPAIVARNANIQPKN